MTAPRQVLPGTTYLLTRRCSERRSLLTPSESTNAIFLYVLAVVARRYNMLVHAFCVMSNHYHLLVTDPDAQLPAFMRDLGSLVARATNASLGHWEGFWASATSYSAVTNGSSEDVVRKAAYVLANPVAAGFVRRGDEWPGLRTTVADIGAASYSVARPSTFFSPTGDLPASAELALTLPPGFSDLTSFQEAVRAEADALEQESRRARAAAGRGFLGRARVLRQDPFARPPGREPRRNLNPAVAAIDPWKRIEALARLTEFRRAYRAAYRALRAGLANVVFPAGTYQLRVELGVACAAPG